MRRLLNIIWLATRDYFDEWQMSGCFVLALAAVLGPMMVLFGLKFGVVGGMVDELVQDPRNREIRPVSSGRYDTAWVENLARRPDVAFALPQTRSIAATIKLKSNTASRIISAELIPTAPGEPLLADGSPMPKAIDEVVLSTSAAQKLKVGVGDVIDGSLSRRFQGNSDRVHLPLKVVAIARANAFGRDGAFAPLSLVEATEDFLDGRAVPALNWNGNAAVAPGERVYPGFRLYATSIYDVATLAEDLTERGVEVRTRAEDIDIVQTMDRNLTFVFWAIAIIGLLGFALSLGASLWANVDRKQRELSVLRLVGFRTGDIIWFPVVQSLYTGVLGWILASAVFLGVAYSINRMLGEQLEAGQVMCQLMPLHYLIALGLTLGASVISAALAGFRSARIEPSDGLREI